MDGTDDLPERVKYMLRAGPREKIFFHPLEVRAAIVTCGGLCPGLNTVIRELVMSLTFCYGARSIYGVQFGYEGFYKHDLVELAPDMVSDIHHNGGTYLGTSRGGFDAKLIADSIERHGLNQVFIVGGDGTHRGAAELHDEIVRRELRVSVVGLCKTIDNDIPFLDKTFGFDSAVEWAVKAITSAHVEIRSAQNGIGLVVLMGRASGFIAAYASLASREVNICLIPEDNFTLDGPGGLLTHLESRLARRGHALIVVAEGAGQHLMEPTGEKDQSGNPKLPDIGSFLKGRIRAHFSERDIHINLKFIDPSYIIRSVPANSSDSIYCSTLAQAAVHGAFAGFGGFTVGMCNNHHVYLPIRCVTNTRTVNTGDRAWQRVLISTGQPDFT